MSTWGSALHQYAVAQRAAGRADGTIRLHRYYLTSLAGHHRSPWQVSPADLEEFLGAPQWAPETRKSARAAVRGFYRWAHRMRQIETDPSSDLLPVAVPRGTARPTPEKIVRRLVARGDRLGHMAMLAAYCGLRRGEIAQVHTDDLVGDSLYVRGKGGKVRAIPLPCPELAEALASADGWLFPNGHGSHLSPGHVGKVLSHAMPRGWTAHTLRHRMASTAYAATRDLLAVGAVLGHSRPETTQRYVRMPDDALRQAVLAATA